MMKKILAYVLVLTLVLGMLPATAMAAESETQTTGTTNSTEPYKVGYSKVDANPYWSVWVAKGNAIPTDKTGYSVTSSDLMPLPMGGYGNNTGRLTKPKLVDDNGSGVGASHVNTSSTTSTYYRDIFLDNNATQNDGDGLWVTAVSIQQGNEAPVVMISVDVIGLSADYISWCKPAIVEACAAYGLTADRVIINATHTHGSIDVGAGWSASELTKTYKVDGYSSATFTGQEIKDYLAAFKPYLYGKMAEAALAALTEAAPAATMEKGTIDVSEATGLQLNGVRHVVGQQTADNLPSNAENFDSPEYVRGSSFNRDIDGSGTEESDDGFVPVTPSDDHMHILRFTFAEEHNKKPVVLVNWRAHTTANNKMGTAAYYNLSSDFVGALRYELEQYNVRPMLIYGASGNLGTGTNGQPGAISSNNPTFNTDENYGSFWVLSGTPYGRKLAEAAKQLLEATETDGKKIINKMTEVSWGPILSQSQPFTMEHRADTTDPLAYAAASAHKAQVTDAVTGNSVGAAKLTTYPWVWCGTYEDANGDIQVGTYVIASQYHANGLLDKYGITTNRTFEINTLLLGPNVAFATVPFEASDRYYNGTDDALTAMQTQNDWDKLGINSTTGSTESWGTPFVMSLVNGSSGYLPNKPAYNYSADLQTETIKTVETAYAGEMATAKAAGVAGVTVYSSTTYNTTTEELDINPMPNDALKFVKGSYESSTTFAAEGTGEKVVIALDYMLEDLRDGTVDYVPEGQIEKYCPACEKTVAWSVFDEAARTYSGNRLLGGHYYLKENYANTKAQITVTLGKVCLDLNGYTYSVDIAEKASRCLIVESTLNVMDTSEGKTGKICSPGMGTGTVAGTLLEDGGGVILVKSGATLNLYGGTVENTNTETCTDMGATIRVIGTFNMYDGTIIGGKATRGGSVYTGGKFNMYGGTVTGGKSTAKGGNIYMAGGTVVINGAVSNGIAGADGASDSDGGNIYMVKGNLTIGGNVSGGTATSSTSSDGGNLYMANGTLKMYGNFTNGQSKEYGGNIQVQGGTAYMYGGSITEGKSGSSISTSGTGANLLLGGTATFRYANGYIPSGTHLMGKTVFISKDANTEIDTRASALKIANAGSSVELDGLFEGNVTLSYSGTNYTSTNWGSVTDYSSIHPNAQLKYSSYYLVVDENNVLVQASSGPDQVATWHYSDGQGTERDVYYYTTNQSKVGAVEGSTAQNPVVLQSDIDSLTLTNDLYLDLNGKNVAAVAENEYTLFCMDSKTDDFTATSGWGTAPKQSNVVALNDYRKVADGFDMIEGRENGTKYYLAFDEEDNRQSFHRIEMLIHTLNINVDKKGISYTASFQGDAKIKENIREFGIAMRAYNAPNETSIWADVDGKTHIKKTQNDWMTGTSLKGVDVIGILTDTPSDPQNVERAKVKIYGSCYIQFTDGTMLFSPKLGLDLHDVKYMVEAAYEGAEMPKTFVDFINEYNNVFGPAN